MLANKTKKTVISDKEAICDSFFCKAIGLMFSLRAKPLFFMFNSEKKLGLHMLFVFFPIDLIFLDSMFRVVELKERFLPFTFYNSKQKARYVMELPAGSVKKSRTAVGDTVIFKR
jgi:uncharacterized membrane protein (UPF0127 family)